MKSIFSSDRIIYSFYGGDDCSVTITWARRQNWRKCHDSARSSSSDPGAGGQREDRTQPGACTSAARGQGHSRAAGLTGLDGSRGGRSIGGQRGPCFRRPPSAHSVASANLRRAGARPTPTDHCCMRPPGTHLSLTLATGIRQRNAAYDLQGVLVPSCSLVEMAPTKPLRAQGPSDSSLVATAPRLCLFFIQQLVNEGKCSALRDSGEHDGPGPHGSDTLRGEKDHRQVHRYVSQERKPGPWRE